jgi:HPt (histidine-containing phosphotransfer) domain-containing protein
MNRVEVDEDLKDIIPNFMANREKDVVAFQEFIVNKDLEGIRKLAHKVAGSSGGYGFIELGEIAKQIEITADESGDLETIETLIISFIDYLSNVEIVYVEGL